MKTKTIHGLFIVLLFCFLVMAIKGQNTLPVYTPDQARNHIEETAIVQGKVFQVYHSRNGNTFLNIGGIFPNNPFSAVIFKDNLAKFQGIDSVRSRYENRIVKVTGVIKEYKGKPEIILNSPAQIEEVKNTNSN